MEQRREALDACLAKLDDRQRRLLERRYDQQRSVDDVASEFGMSVEAVYKAISRLRQRLHECIDQALATEGGADV